MDFEKILKEILITNDGCFQSCIHAEHLKGYGYCDCNIDECMAHDNYEMDLYRMDNKNMRIAYGEDTSILSFII